MPRSPQEADRPRPVTTRQRASQQEESPSTPDDAVLICATEIAAEAAGFRHWEDNHTGTPAVSYGEAPPPQDPCLWFGVMFRDG